jgi:acyl-coenzyme A synthetase/AMP-(fatty) acid ligase
MLLNNFYEFLVRKTDFDIPFFIDEKVLYTRYDLYKVVFLLWKRVNSNKIDGTNRLVIVSDDGFIFCASIFAASLNLLDIHTPNSLSYESVKKISKDSLIVYESRALYESLEKQRISLLSNENVDASISKNNDVSIIKQSDGIDNSFLDNCIFFDEIIKQSRFLNDISIKGVAGFDEYKKLVLNALNNQVYSEVSIVQYTSGTTGVSKSISRTINSFMLEAIGLSKALRVSEHKVKESKDIILVATVPLFHAYGIMMRFFVPIVSMLKMYSSIIEYEEQFKSLLTRSFKFALVISPLFVKRTEFSLPKGKVVYVTSAGSKLDSYSIEKAKHFCDIEIFDLFGSTETGCMGYRYVNHGEELLSVLDGNEINVFTSDSNDLKDITSLEQIEQYNEAIKSNGVGRILLKGPYLRNGFFLGDDVIELEKDNSFKVLGRIGRLVKLEDNRVSLDEIETTIRKLNLIKDAAIISYCRGVRQYLGAAIVLDAEGKRLLNEIGKGKFVIHLRKLLTNRMLQIAIPRSFHIYDELPLLPNGKVAYKQIQTDFE